MPNPSPQVSESPSVRAEPQQDKLNKRIIQASISLILMFFATSFMLILVKLPGSF
jgi:hypothetical protein